MPRRWLVPLPGMRPEYVRPWHVHGAVSGWFDYTPAEHHANDKPYAVWPLITSHRVGVQVATLTEDAEARFQAATSRGQSVRLGNQTREIGGPRMLAQASWAELAARRGSRRWVLHFQTATTFRSGDQSSPFPQPATVLRGLGKAWSMWSDVALPGIDTRSLGSSVRVDALDLSSSIVTVDVGSQEGGARINLWVSAVTGQITFVCQDRVAAATVGPLLELAAFAGVGSMTLKGLGVTQVKADRPASGPQAKEAPARRPRGEPGERGQRDGLAG